MEFSWQLSHEYHYYKISVRFEYLKSNQLGAVSHGLTSIENDLARSLSYSDVFGL